MVQVTELEKELANLLSQGELLRIAMADEQGRLGEETRKQVEELELQLPSFQEEYDSWYSVAHRVVTQLLPDRVDDFVLQYKDPKRKEISYLTYTISDYLLGLTTRQYGEVVADQNAALPKMQRQLAILRSAKAVFRSSLTDLAEVLQADLFDSELDAADALASRGFLRGGGAIAGVVLEKHLAHVCDVHGVRIRKKRPTINDYNQMLKDKGVIDTAKWRFIQHLADLRNICDHHKEREPTKDDVQELVEGVKKVIKTVM